jgi:dsRNA-specific ribonuclease
LKDVQKLTLKISLGTIESLIGKIVLDEPAQESETILLDHVSDKVTCR